MLHPLQTPGLVQLFGTLDVFESPVNLDLGRSRSLVWRKRIYSR